MSATHVFLFGPRACGKSTIGKLIAARLPGWSAIDIDHEFHARYESQSVADRRDVSYYAACRRILLDNLGRERTIFSMSGGDLVNSVAPEICEANLTDCRRHGPLVLVLPSRFLSRTVDILFERENSRSYAVPKDFLRQELSRRLPTMKQHADVIVHGTDSERLARRIVSRCRLA